VPEQLPARRRILDAAEHLMRTIGLARVTTKEIARAAGCSEAAIYKYYAGKEDLFIAVLETRLPPLGSVLADLSTPASLPELADALREVLRQAALFYESSVPIAGSLLAEPALLERHREGLTRIGAGPHVPFERLAEYLARAVAAGVLPAAVSPGAASAMLMGACFQRAFLARFSPPAPPPEPAAAFADALVTTFLAPAPARGTP
jgi:AcrR family transcriptional regulator